MQLRCYQWHMRAHCKALLLLLLLLGWREPELLWSPLGAWRMDRVQRRRLASAAE